MPIRRYYVTRRYSRRNTTPDAHCNQFGVGMRDPLICVRVLRASVSAPDAYYADVHTYIRTLLHRRCICAPMQLDTGQRYARTRKRDRVQSHSDSAGFMLLAPLINACANGHF